MLRFGIGPTDFEAMYFERNVYLHRGALSENTVSWSALDQLLYQIEPREPSVALYRGGPISPPTYTSTSVEFGTPRVRFNKPGLYQLLATGATLVINRLENHLLAARRLCSEVCRFTGQQTMSNAYLSFRGDGTFGRHWDTHDVFAIQLQGRKRWQVFGATFPLPLSHQKSEPHERECPADPLLDCILDPGDLLYVPRGWWHRAIPLDTASFHVSIGAYAPTLYDYLVWSCTRYLPQQAFARQALSRVSDPDEVATLLRELTSKTLDPGTVAEFAREMQSRERTQTEFNLDLLLNQSEGALPLDTMLSMNGNCYHVGGSEILVNGNRWQMSATEDAVLRLLNQYTSLSVRALGAGLPDLPAAQIAAAVRKLLRCEVLTASLSA